MTEEIGRVRLYSLTAICSMQLVIIAILSFYGFATLNALSALHLLELIVPTIALCGIWMYDADAPMDPICKRCCNYCKSPRKECCCIPLASHQLLMAYLIWCFISFAICLFAILIYSNSLSDDVSNNDVVYSLFGSPPTREYINQTVMANGKIDGRLVKEKGYVYDPVDISFLSLQVIFQFCGFVLAGFFIKGRITPGKIKYEGYA